MTKVPKAVLDAVRRAPHVVIASHENPDGDALGSSLGFALALRSLGKRVTVFNRDPVPDFYRFLPSSPIVTPRFPVRTADGTLLVLLDCNSAERAGIASTGNMRSLVIDHHKTEGSFGDIRWVDRDAAATGILVHRLIKALRIPLTKPVAVNLYAAIALDTGTFRYRNATADVLRVAAELVDAGAEPHLIAEALYESWSMQRLNLLLEALKTLRIEGDIATMCLSLDAFRASGAQLADTENFSNFPRQVRGINLSVLFRELSPGIWKASLRSKGSRDASGIAEGFGGGGHRNAAGYRVTGTREEVLASFFAACRTPLPAEKGRRRSSR